MSIFGQIYLPDEINPPGIGPSEITANQLSKRV
jgi:hypothetical protein